MKCLYLIYANRDETPLFENHSTRGCRMMFVPKNYFIGYSDGEIFLIDGVLCVNVFSHVDFPYHCLVSDIEFQPLLIAVFDIVEFYVWN
jgi:hypothetical protein